MSQNPDHYDLGKLLGRGALSAFYTCRRSGVSGSLHAVKVMCHSGRAEPYYTAARQSLAVSTTLNEAGGHVSPLSQPVFHTVEA
jgi:hypothetical protein